MAGLIKSVTVIGEITLPAPPGIATPARPPAAAAVVAQPQADPGKPKAMPPILPYAAQQGEAAGETSPDTALLERRVEGDAPLARNPTPAAQTNTPAPQALPDVISGQLQELEEEARKKGYGAGFIEGEKVGYEEGYAQGQSKAQAGIAESRLAFADLIESANATIATTLADSEAVIGAIVFQAVCKIVGEALHTAEGTAAIVAQALVDAKRQEIVSVKVSAADMARLLDTDQQTPQSARLRGLNLEVDDSVELGGCIVQLKGGHIDARIETQFRAFAQSLREALMHAH